MSERGRVVEILNRRRRPLSPTQRRVAEYVLRQYQDVAFMSVAELAKAAKVSPAGVVRFATSLNFDGYPEFKRALHDIVRSELRQDERLSATLHGRFPRVLAGRIIEQELRNLAVLKSTFNASHWNQAVRLILAAPAVMILGFRASATLAHYLWYNLRKVKPHVGVHMRSGSVTFEDLQLSDRKALLMPITFPRYSQELLDVASFGKQAGFRSLGLTDNELSPLAALCSHTLFVEVGEASFTDFHAAPVALLNALVAEIAARSSARSLNRLKQLDDLAAERAYLFRPRRKGAELVNPSAGLSSAGRLERRRAAGRKEGSGASH
jgi:DNA-binding MurR/RpiR family transcriptional regulator